MALVLIGYWQSAEHPEWPDPRTLVDPSWDEHERHIVRRYLSSGTIVRAYMGFSTCRLCGKHNGAVEFSDGTFVWPEGLSHYLEEHAVRLPAAIVKHAVQRVNELEDSPVDSEWWLAQGSGRAAP